MLPEECKIHLFCQVFHPLRKEWLIVCHREDGTLYLLENAEIPQLYLSGGLESTLISYSDTFDSALEPEDDDYERYFRSLEPFWSSLERDHVLFAKMAGVNNFYRLLNVKEPRGFPVDLDPRATSLFSNDQFLSSYSWLDDDEIYGLDMEELPRVVHSYYVSAQLYEDRKKLYLTSTPFLYISQDELLTDAVGFIYPLEVWEQFTQERKDRELSNGRPVYVEDYRSQTIGCPSYPAMVDRIDFIKAMLTEEGPPCKVRMIFAFEKL